MEGSRSAKIIDMVCIASSVYAADKRDLVD
jgi:hypothetical protein